jgi:phosphoglucosamine mutase
MDGFAIEIVERWLATADAEKLLNGNGRVLVRPSGTEPLVRVMVEGIEERTVHQVCDIIITAIESVKE